MTSVEASGGPAQRSRNAAVGGADVKLPALIAEPPNRSSCILSSHRRLAIASSFGFPPSTFRFLPFPFSLFPWSLFALQRDERIDAGGAPRRQIRRNQDHGAEDHGDGGERQRVAGA